MCGCILAPVEKPKAFDYIPNQVDIIDHMMYRKNTGGEFGRPSPSPIFDNPTSTLDSDFLLTAPITVPANHRKKVMSQRTLNRKEKSAERETSVHRMNPARES